MSRSLQLLFRRDPARDRQDVGIHFEGYQVLWPDYRPVGVAMDAFCKHGQRLLGLGKHLGGRREQLVELLCYDLSHREDDLTRLPGHRVRRFGLKRVGQEVRMCFLDGTPTTTVFHLINDDVPVLDLFDLRRMREGEQRWVDLAARPVEASVSSHRRLSDVHA